MTKATASPSSPGIAATLDHVVIGTDRLESGTTWTEARLHAQTDGGGAHPLMATHNRLMRLAGGPYLEVIAIDPDAPAPARPRWFTLDSMMTLNRLASGPAALCWVAAVPDIERAAADCGYDCGRIIEVSRGTLHWRLTVADDGGLPTNGILPSLIEWPDGIHPVASLVETDIALQVIKLRHPDPAYITACLGGLGLMHYVEVANGDPAIAFDFTTPQGTVSIA